MLNCSEYRELMLDYLYGLLEESDNQALRDHLPGCAACQQALEEAKHQQSLLARAALKCREVPAFEAPAHDTLPFPALGSVPSAPAAWKESPATSSTVPMPDRPGRWRRWLSVAAAAAVLVAVSSVYGGYHRGLEDRQKALSGARKQLETADSKLIALTRGFEVEKLNLAKRTEGQFLHVEVLGPASYQPSAPSAYWVTTKTPKGLPASGTVSVNVTIQETNGKVSQVFSSRSFPTKGSVQVVVPAQLKVKPGDTPSLMIEALTGQTNEFIEQTLVVEEPTYVTHLALNKSVFRPGETVLFRMLTLDRFALTPVDRPLTLSCKLYRTGGANQDPALVKELHCATQDGGVSGGEFVVTNDLLPGEYLFVVGEAETAKGKPSAVRAVSRTIIVEQPNNAVLQSDNKLNNKGKVAPIASQNPTAEFFPEGGDWVIGGSEQRVYYRLHFPLGVPEGLEAVVVNGNQKEVVKLSWADSLKDRDIVVGSFALSPQAGESYRLRLAVAEKQLASWPLPKANESSVVLHVPRAVVQANEPLLIQLEGRGDGPHLVLVNCRGRTVQQWIVPPSHGGAGLATLAIEPSPAVHGIMRVTVYEKDGEGWRPAAERLVYRQPRQYLKLATKFDKNSVKGYKPGDKVDLRIEARAETNAFKASWLHALVIDDTPGRHDTGSEVGLASYFLLTADLSRPEDLEDAGVLLSNGPKAAKALDLFLGTQGWRRFAKSQEKTPAKLMAQGKQVQPGEPSIFAAANRDVLGFYANTLKLRENDLVQDTIRQRADLQTQRDNAESAARTAAANLAEYEQLPLTWLRYGAGAAVALLISLGAVLLFAGLIVALRARSSPRLLLAGSCSSLVVALIIFASISSLRTVEDFDPGHAFAGWVGPLERQFAANIAPADQRVLPEKEHGAKAAVAVYAAASLEAQDAVKKLQVQRATLAGNQQTNNLSMNLNNLSGAAKQGAIGAKGGGGAFGGGMPVPPALDQNKGTFQGQQQALPGKTEEAKGADKGLVVSTAMRAYANIPSEPDLGQQGLLLWQPLLFAPDGTAQVAFDLPGQQGTYRVVIQGHTDDGRLGEFQGTLVSGK